MLICKSFDPECRPSREQQIEFAKTYLDEFVKATKQKFAAQDQNKTDQSQNDVTTYLKSMKLDVDAILNEANHFELISHLIYAIWSLGSVAKSEAYNFDYMVN